MLPMSSRLTMDDGGGFTTPAHQPRYSRLAAVTATPMTDDHDSALHASQVPLHEPQAQSSYSTVMRAPFSPALPTTASATPVRSVGGFSGFGSPRQAPAPTGRAPLTVVSTATPFRSHATDTSFPAASPAHSVYTVLSTPYLPPNGSYNNYSAHRATSALASAVHTSSAFAATPAARAPAPAVLQPYLP